MSPSPRLRTPWTAIATILMLPIAGACGDTTGPGDGADPVTQLPRALTADEQAVIARSTGFGMELMARSVAEDDRPNIVLSPLSASMALGMTMNGAVGPTFDAMRATLGFDGLTQEQINSGYQSLIELLTALDPEVDVRLGNAVWANDGVPFHTDFFDTVREAFDAAVETRDFADASTLDAINAWADQATNGMIERVLNELDPDLVLLLMNAVAFDASWTERFDPDDTRSAEFRRADGSTVAVDMMQKEGVELPLGSGDGWTAVEIPYGGGAYAMVVVVPWQDDVRPLVAEWDAADWAGLKAALTVQELDLLRLPRFTVAHDAFLNPVLEAMGMGIAFGSEADFSGLSPIGAGLCIDFVRQKSFIEVDEAGTRAAAVTTVGIGPTSFTGLIADRPFFFALHERLSGTLLFTGVIGDPGVEDSGPAEGSGRCH
ncbi:MAG: serpin family protein [Gemmatimonadetes bacterium]|nr:serpin family protein [Gemmatimonadota bacterium]NNF37020.1 serpin family protein [Gemmatimonadota bacterium]